MRRLLLAIRILIRNKIIWLIWFTASLLPANVIKKKLGRIHFQWQHSVVQHRRTTINHGAFGLIQTSHSTIYELLLCQWIDDNVVRVPFCIWIITSDTSLWPFVRQFYFVCNTEVVDQSHICAPFLTYFNHKNLIHFIWNMCMDRFVARLRCSTTSKTNLYGRIEKIMKQSRCFLKLTTFIFDVNKEKCLNGREVCSEL